MLFDYLVFRKMCTEADYKRDEGLTTPDCIERFDNIAYGADTETQVLDLYRPKEYSGKLPAIAFTAAGGSMAIRTYISSIAWILHGVALPWSIIHTALLRNFVTRQRSRIRTLYSCGSWIMPADMI